MRHKRGLPHTYLGRRAWREYVDSTFHTHNDRFNAFHKQIMRVSKNRRDAVSALNNRLTALEHLVRRQQSIIRELEKLQGCNRHDQRSICPAHQVKHNG